ncbi:hypothetical protein M7I_8187 [Glarea lozoyensis 74030]|uniref:Uncharacterized protein n=1 Tax=Glarea lozoyensis (strain ATCC 74030 / MF5533) TaxID=1104152 RepID=H0EZC4_GLAL7|nr:hypothetical protein M7I_8187 [Glarea lozoyensis 74030]
MEDILCIGSRATGSFSSCFGSNTRCLDCTGISIQPTAKNAPATTVNCVPSGFVVAHSTEPCATQAVLLIPLIVSNVVVVAVNVVLSRLKFQNKVKFWGEPSTVDDKWAPWSGLTTVPLVVVQAVASAALIRAGGYLASWVDLILLWLLRPRTLWFIMFLYGALGNEYQRSATDYLA